MEEEQADTWNIFLDRAIGVVYTVIIVYIQYARRRGVFLDIIIRNTNSQPIYEQIYTQIKSSIISGTVQPGEMLPSIRSLAKDLRISVITTKRAYDELEKDGYLYTVAAKGCYVAERNTELIREANLKQIEDYMRKIMQLTPSCGLSDHEVIEMFRMIQEEESLL